jgi:hypothetical protein
MLRASKGSLKKTSHFSEPMHLLGAFYTLMHLLGAFYTLMHLLGAFYTLMHPAWRRCSSVK